MSIFLVIAIFLFNCAGAIKSQEEKSPTDALLSCYKNSIPNDMRSDMLYLPTDIQLTIYDLIPSNPRIWIKQFFLDDNDTEGVPYHTTVYFDDKNTLVYVARHKKYHDNTTKCTYTVFSAETGEQIPCQLNNAERVSISASTLRCLQCFDNNGKIIPVPSSHIIKYDKECGNLSSNPICKVLDHGMTSHHQCLFYDTTEAFYNLCQTLVVTSYGSAEFLYLWQLNTQLTLMQRLLCKFLFTWLLVKKQPYSCRTGSVSYLVNDITSFFQTFPDENWCYKNKLWEIWDTIDQATQESIKNKIDDFITRYGKD